MIELESVTLTYDGAPEPTLRDVDLTISEGDLCLVVGSTGSGKSTLLGLLNGLVPHFTGGTLQGSVTVDGRSTRTTRPRELADVVGYVAQDPLAGFVTDTVEEEIAYGMEQLGLAPATMRKRVEESLDLLGIAELRQRALTDLSGGQQQRVAIASVMAMHPRILVLDEPTSALDPTAAQDVLAALTGLVHETGLTVVIAEHRLERVMHAADTIVWVRPDGRVESGDPSRMLSRADVDPPLARLAGALGWSDVPLSVRQARRRAGGERLAIKAPAAVPTRSATVPMSATASGDAARPTIQVQDLWVRYGAVPAIRALSTTFEAGTVTALMGRNGSGKSSLLWAMQGTGKRSGGEVLVEGQDPSRWSPRQARSRVVLIPQTASDLLYRHTVAAELGLGGAASDILQRLGVELDPQAHPRDLSEGQRLALVLAIQLAHAPDVVLLDEPTRGLDYAAKDQLVRLCQELAARGVAVVVSTHDVEFAAQASTRTVVLAEGEIVADGTTRSVCTASPAYAPQVAKVFSPVPVLTVDEVVAGLGEVV